ncbi:hypothetical protein D3C72_2272580 [compost metagenome]
MKNSSSPTNRASAPDNRRCSESLSTEKSHSSARFTAAPITTTHHRTGDRDALETSSRR